METVERLIRAGLYTGPLNLNYVAIGGASAFHPADLVEFARRTPDGAVLTIESIMRSTLPMNTIAIALGLHVRVGIEDNLWAPRKERITSVQQVEQLVRIADELGRDIATAQEARRIYPIGEYWTNADETLDHLGLPPNRRPGERGVPLRHPSPARGGALA
ncbi:3-keto-5-aminohexanoate cleavage protein [Streptomyces sp. 1114.5]|uniref:3-keto-5-aminohexanoate cleavage protein n=1 Tax=Streptomyces sp. 1114.5 TaxID=1938830 RepID=UPI0028778BCA|nr:3-keto-5-aminohexanoate cleavage protein [Streptomyces sp. 1114.5]